MKIKTFENSNPCGIFSTLDFFSRILGIIVCRLYGQTLFKGVRPIIFGTTFTTYFMRLSDPGGPRMGTMGYPLQNSNILRSNSKHLVRLQYVRISFLRGSLTNDAWRPGTRAKIITLIRLAAKAEDVSRIEL